MKVFGGAGVFFKNPRVVLPRGGRGSFLKERTKELSDWESIGVLQTDMVQFKLRLILSLLI